MSVRQMEGVEPDYEAAEALFGDDLAWIVEACGDNRDGPNLAVDALVKRVVDAALRPATDARRAEEGVVTQTDSQGRKWRVAGGVCRGEVEDR